MSGRYSLRQTPRKKELFDGMVQTPGRRTSRRKSQFPLDGSDADADSSSATEMSAAKPTTTTRAASRSLRKRGTAKFVEHIDETEDEHKDSALDDDDDDDAGTNKNGHTAKSSGNGHAAEKDEKDNKKPVAIDGWIPGTDPKVDTSGVFEFGGSWGTGAMMIGFPILMWYMWIGATYYDGKFPSRAPGQSWADFGAHMVDLVYTGAFPHARGWAMYWIFFVFEMAMYCLMPGVKGYGKPLPHLGGKQLPYHCSAVPSFYTTLVVAFVLHFTGLFKLYTLIDEFGSIMSVAILSGFLVATIIFVSAHIRGATHRMTGYPVYDFFMGAELNPRLFGILDFKMFFEVRLPWFILLLLSIGAAARQWERYGYVSGEVCFIVMAHFLYANACAKGEELIITTWDMYWEKLGFMLTFWNMAGVPLSYCHCTIYLANHDPSEYHWHPAALAVLFASYLFVYWVWDTCNSQKNRFRAAERNTLVQRNAFPQLPWQTLKNPVTIETRTGDKILCDGWYGMARKVHYTCDAFFAICWGLITGFNSPFPWFYPVFFCCMIAHRAARDIEKCRTKYGEAWTEYERRVPYLFIPYVF